MKEGSFHSVLPLFRTRLSLIAILSVLVWIFIMIVLVIYGMGIVGLLLYGALSLAVVTWACHDSFILTVYDDHFRISWLFRYKSRTIYFKEIKKISYDPGKRDSYTRYRTPDYIYIEVKNGEDIDIYISGHRNPVNHREDCKRAIELIQEKLLEQ